MIGILLNIINNSSETATIPAEASSSGWMAWGIGALIALEIHKRLFKPLPEPEKESVFDQIGKEVCLQFFNYLDHNTLINLSATSKKMRALFLASIVNELGDPLPQMEQIINTTRRQILQSENFEVSPENILKDESYSLSPALMEIFPQLRKLQEAKDTYVQWHIASQTLQEILPLQVVALSFLYHAMKAEVTQRIPKKFGNYALTPEADFIEKMKSFSKWIKDYSAELSHLTYLDLSKYHFHFLNPIIFELSAIKELDLSHNQLREIPDDIKKLTSLEVLNLSHNQLTSIPAEIESLPHLRQLVLHSNPLTSIPSEVIRFLSQKET